MNSEIVRMVAIYWFVCGLVSVWMFAFLELPPQFRIRTEAKSTAALRLVIYFVTGGFLVPVGVAAFAASATATGLGHYIVTKKSK